MPYLQPQFLAKENRSSFHWNFINLRGLSVKPAGLLVKHIRIWQSTHTQEEVKNKHILKINTFIFQPVFERVVSLTANLWLSVWDLPSHVFTESFDLTILCGINRFTYFIHFVSFHVDPFILCNNVRLFLCCHIFVLPRFPFRPPLWRTQ